MTTVIALIIVLGVLIFVHELGHFLAAKAVDIEVERFSIGLGPKVFGFQWGETEYVLSAIPLGGYVKMGGMDDEVMESIEGGKTEQTPREPGPRDYDAKPIWARTLVISAGVIMNMLFAFAVYTGTAFMQEVPGTTRIGYIDEAVLPAETSEVLDLPIGATIERVGDEMVEHWGDVQEALLNAAPGPLAVELTQPARTVTLDIPADLEARTAMIRSIEWWMDASLSQVVDGSPASEAGLEAGDVIVSVDGTPTRNWNEFRRMIRPRAETPTQIVYQRGGQTNTITLTPNAAQDVDPDSFEPITVGQIGVERASDLVTYSVGLVEAVRLGWQETLFFTNLILDFLKQLFTGGISPRSVGSVFTIGEASGQAAALGMEVFFEFMAFFSINLAILNLLPIPILDGGHLVFLGVEAVRGKALSVQTRIRWSQVGFVIVMGLMIWALGNDILRLFGI